MSGFEQNLMLNVLKVFGLSTLSFFFAIAATPTLTHYLYKYQMWKKTSGKKALTGGEAVIFNELHKDKEVGTPRMGGILVWGSTLTLALLFWLLAEVFNQDLFTKLNFVSQNQTWIPIFTLLAAALLGLADDLSQIWGTGKYFSGGIPLLTRILVVAAIGFVGAYWFYYKLEFNSVYVPGYGALIIGALYIPLFITVMIATFSGGVIDGIDGLAGGVMAAIFAAYSGIAFFQNQIDLAAFCGVIMGALLAFLWFNIPPARFYMGETGMLGLTTTLTVIAFLTDSVLVLPIIAFPLVAASGSDIIQIASKKFLGRKVFRVAPIQHHFEALGWPSYKVTMRFWVVSTICAVLGMVITLIGR